MSLVRIVLIAVLIGGGAYWYLDNLQRERETAKRLQNNKAQQAKLNEGFDLRSPNPVGATDNGMIGLPSGYHPSASPWESAERARYRALFSANSFDVLIVPFQVKGYALDRSTRSLMFAELSMAVGGAGINVPDPYTVLRALGENRRQFNPDDVYELARHLGAKRVIWTFAGHDRKNGMALEFRIKEPDRDGKFGGPMIRAVGRFDNVAFSSESPPVLAYQPLLPQIVEKLGYKPPAPSARVASRFDGAALPSSPRAMVADQPDPARDAFSFLMFAALTPATAQRASERFVEKAFLATLLLSEDYPDYRLLRARTLMLMGLRQAALLALGQPSTEEEKALLGMLNGNLPQVAAATPRVKPMLKRNLAELDFAQITTEYGLEDNARRAAAVKRLAPPGSIWSLFFARALSDAETWTQFDNLTVKELLDAELPVQGFTAAGIVSGSMALADPVKLQGATDFSVFNHVRQVMERDAAKLCCISDPARLSTMDYLDLVDAIGFDNLARRVTLIGRIQGRPQEALVELGRLEAVYKGHPHFSLLRAYAESAVAFKSDNAAKEGLMRSAYVNAFDAFYYEQGQTVNAGKALQAILQLGRADFGQWSNVYAGDIPYRPYYPAWDVGNMEFELKNARAALETTTIDAQPVFTIGNLLVNVRHEDAAFGEFLKSIEGRFEGNADLAILQGNIYYRLGNSAAAEARYREALKSQPGLWQPHQALANFLFRDARVDEAARIVRSYPGFLPASSENAVGIANDAYEAGSSYYWSGRFDLAKPLYTIAANLRTGADSSMASESRLKLHAGDFAGALKGTYERATRYGSSYAYRDYMGFLHAMGYSKEAWDGFILLVSQMPQPHIWESALVGHRRAGSSDQDILAWVNQDVLRHAGEHTSYAAMYLLRAAITDRVPMESTPAAVGQVDRAAWKIADSGNHVVKASPVAQRYDIVGPSTDGDASLPIGVFEGAQKVRVKSDMEYFAQAYRLLRTGNNEGALALFDEASTLYDLTHYSKTYVLPYLAFAAAKSANTAGIEKLLAGFRIDQQEFDYWLSKAVLLAVAGKPDESIPLLKRALYRRPYTESRPMFSEYEYAEIVELLYEATRNPRYRDLALEWARSCQANQPWHAWPYAMQANLLRGGPERRQAIAMAHYLDPNSERLKAIPKREIEGAVKEYGSRNPFLNMKEPKEEKPI